VPRPSHSSPCDSPINMGWAVQIIQQFRSFSSTDQSAVQIIQLLTMEFLHSPFTSFPLGPFILPNTPFPNQ
jgi:hypothetical protein